MAILKNVSEIHYTLEFVLFLMTSCMSFIFVRNVLTEGMLKLSQCPTSESTWCQLVLLLDHLVKVRSARFLPCKVTFFPLYSEFFFDSNSEGLCLISSDLFYLEILWSKALYVAVIKPLPPKRIPKFLSSWYDGKIISITFVLKYNICM